MRRFNIENRRLKIIFGFLVALVSIFLLAAIFYVTIFSDARFITSNALVVTPENLSDLKDKIADGQIVQVNGEPNNNFVMNSSGNQKLYSLKEYGFNILVISQKDPSLGSVQTYTGKAVKLKNVSNYADILRQLNDSLKIDELKNNPITANFSEETLNEIIGNSKGEFTDQAMVITDGQHINEGRIFSNIIILVLLFFILGILLFRNRIAKLREYLLVND